MFQFDIMTIRPLLDALYLNGLDLYPDDFARLIQASAPTKAQVAQALGGSLGEMANHQAILTNELHDLDNRERRKGSRPQGEIEHVQARANQAAEGLVLATLAVMRRHRAILIGQYQADYEGRHPEYTVNWPGTEGGVPQLGERDDEPNPFTTPRD